MTSIYSTTADENLVGPAGLTLNRFAFYDGFGNDTITDAMNGSELDFLAVTSSMTINFNLNSLTVGDDSLNWGTEWLRAVTTGSGNDTIIGDDFANRMNGGRGNDTLSGGDWADTYVFMDNWGVDTIVETPYISPTSIDANYLDLTKVTTNLTVNFDLLSGPEVVSGINTIDWDGKIFRKISSGSGNDVVTGNTDFNEISGGMGNDTLSGGSGADNYFFNEAWGHDTIIEDAVGSNMIEFIGYSSLSVNLAYKMGKDEITDGVNSVNWKGQILYNIVTGYGNDIVHGNELNNFLITGEGDDEAYGKGGDDNLRGYKGHDRLYGDSGNDIFWGSEGRDLLYGGDGNDSLYGDEHNDTLYGDAGDDILYGDDGRDILSGGDGNDTLVGDRAIATFWYENDQLIGGNGNDNYLFNVVAFGNDLIIDTSGSDILDLSTLSLSGANFYAIDGSDGDINIDQLVLVYQGNASIAIENYFDNLNTDVGVSGSGNGLIESILFSGSNLNFTQVKTLLDPASQLSSDMSNDILNGQGGTIYGGNGNDTLSNAGYLFGGDGNDTMIGTSGLNRFYGGAGNDSQDGQGGEDHYYFEDNWGLDTITDTASTANSVNLDDVSRDLIINLISGVGHEVTDGINTINWANSSISFVASGFGNDTIYGNNNASFNGYLYGNAGNDQIFGLGGIDYLYGGMGNDTLDGGDQNDFIRGDSGNDTLFGGNGDDLLYGYGEHDTLDGGSGNDYLEGDVGFDLLKGGDGNDTYFRVYDADIIEDTSGTADILDLNYEYTLSDVKFISAVDGSDAGNNLDHLIINFKNGFTFSVLNYFNNTSSSVSTCTAGTGLIENILFSDINLTFSEVQSRAIARFGFYGTNLDDSIIGTSLSDSFNEITRDGNDVLDGGQGFDSVDYDDGISSNIVFKLFSGNVQREGHTDVLMGMEKVKASNAHNDLLDATFVSDHLTINLQTGAFSKVAEGGPGPHSADLNNLSNLEEFEYVIGGNGNDDITGNDANNFIIGGLGNDTLKAGAGDDVYGDGGVLDGGNDTISDSSGIDALNLEELVSSGISFFAIDLDSNGYADGISLTYGSNSILIKDYFANTSTLTSGTGLIENIVFSDIIIDYTNALNRITVLFNGSSGIDIINGTVLNDVLSGFDGNDVLNAMSGNDTLDGGTGNDAMSGGQGDDTYEVDSISDTVTENTSEGTDTVRSTINHTLGSNVENLILMGTAINANGNVLNNVLTGNEQNNWLNGQDGNDTLDGGLGNDQLYGGLGNDTITGGDGIDSIYGNDGDDLIDANAGNDYIVGGAGIDTINGGDGDDQLWAQDGDDILNGGAGNDLLEGGAGNDTMSGGAGDDAYRVYQAGDTAIESAGEGMDTVYAQVDFIMGANIENLIFMGAGNLNGTGNAENNSITGTGGNNTLDGGDGNDNLNAGMGNDTLIGGNGNDFLYGGGNADTMTGGAGNDTYQVDNTSDLVTEISGEGIDSVQATLTHNLAANVENLYLQGTNNMNGSGNAENNTIVGNSGNNVLYGYDGNDYLSAGAGNDSVLGGNGNDTLIGGIGNDALYGELGNDNYLGFTTGFGDDTVIDVGGIELIDLSAFNSSTATWSAIDSNTDGRLDRLQIDLSTGDSILVGFYFNNTNIDDDFSGAGAGYIEEIRFSDTSIDFTDVQGLIA